MKRLHPFAETGRISMADLVAGLSIAGLLLPEAVAYSGIANLPPQSGIVALFAGLLCYGLLGTSRFAIVSATSSSAVVLAAATASLAGGDENLRIIISVILVLIAGLFFLLAALARLGNITDFIAKPVLRGFVFGLAIVIVMKQFAVIVGEHGNGSTSNVFRFAYNLFADASNWNPYGVAIAGGALLVLFLFSRYKRIPVGLIVIALGVVLSKVVDLESLEVGQVGQIDLNFSEISVPHLGRDQWLRMAELGLALALVVYPESYGSVRNFAMKHGDKVSPNRDLFALGISNLVSGLFRGMPVAAGYSATLANEEAGALSRWSGLVAAGVVAAIVLLLLPAIALTPVPVLSAIVINAVAHTLNPAIFKPYFRWKRDRLIVVTAVAGVLLFGVLNGLLVAVVVSIAMLLKRLSESKISLLGRLEESHDFVDIAKYADAKAEEGILIFRPEEPLFFANCERILNEARNHVLQSGNDVRHVIISMEESPDIDGTTLESFESFFRFIREQKKYLILARLKEPGYELLRKVTPETDKTIKLSYLSVDDAVNTCRVG